MTKNDCYVAIVQMAEEVEDDTLFIGEYEVTSVDYSDGEFSLDQEHDGLDYIVVQGPCDDQQGFEGYVRDTVADALAELQETYDLSERALTALGNTLDSMLDDGEVIFNSALETVELHDKFDYIDPQEPGLYG